MTFQRWARLLIGVLKEDDFIVSRVKADIGGESVCWRWSLLKLTIYKFIITAWCKKCVAMAMSLIKHHIGK